MTEITEKKRKIDFYDGQVCTGIGLWVNVVLTAFKLFAGIVGHSKAMIADALHSASDVLATAIVAVGLRIAKKPADEDHPYGHGNADTIASFIVALILLLTGLYLGFSAVHVFVDGYRTIPSSIALYAAIASIFIKEAMYQYTIRVGRRLNSQAIIANAWDHRSDAFSSIPATIGIFIARVWNLPIFDPIAGLVIAVMIFRISLHLLHSSVDIIMDETPDQKTMKEIADTVSKVDGVVTVHEIKVHQHGPDITVDIKIEVNGLMSVNEGHSVAGKVKAELMKSKQRVTDVMVHVNPVEKIS